MMSVVKALFQKEMEGKLMTLEICYTVMHLLYVCPQLTFETKKQLLKDSMAEQWEGCIWLN